MNQNQDKRIIIIGAGIAGCTSAIGLKKLGFDVTIIYKNRPFIAYEGFSEKTKEGLISQECINTSKLLAKQSLRNSNWANSSNQVNYEYVVCRKDLDEALLNDVKEKDIKMIEAKVVGSIDDKKDKAKITCKINERLVINTKSFKEFTKQNNIKLLLGDWTKRDQKIGNWLKSQGLVGVPAYFVIHNGKLKNLGETITISKIKDAFN